jgi:tRNA threonylcarbamoyladenosine biosynthesis protein TsaE
MVTLISRSPEETIAIGEQWGREAQRGWVIGLSGDLGAGKTQLVKGIVRGLGSSARVHSPTFALLHEYEGGRLQIFHLDLYRLSNRDEVIRAGLEEYLLRPTEITIVEWIDRWLPDSRTIDQGSRSERPVSNTITRIAHLETLDDTERRITYEDFGA